MLYRKTILNCLLGAALALTSFSSNCAAEVQQDDELHIESRILLCEFALSIQQRFGVSLDVVDYAIVHSQCKQYGEDSREYDECAQIWIERFKAWCTPYILLLSIILE